MEMLNQKQKIIAVIVIAVVVIVIAYYYINSTKEVYTNQSIGNIVEETEEEQGEEKTKKELIKVHITGSIKSNGIVEIEKNSRINDAIEAAGGLTEDADLSNVNLAYMIEDGQKIYIPSIDDKEESKNTQTNSSAQINSSQEEARQEQEVTFILSGPGNGITEEKEKNTNKVNINKAAFVDLITLPGIGEATAVKILEYRKANGNFKTIEEIKNVSGIGEAKFNVIKEFISV